MEQHGHRLGSKRVAAVGNGVEDAEVTQDGEIGGRGNVFYICARGGRADDESVTKALVSCE